MKYRILLFVLVFSLSKASAAPGAQLADTPYIPFNRLHFHDLIKEQQRLTDKQDGKEDGQFRPGSNDNVNLQLTDALFRKITKIRYWVEENEKINTPNEKVRYLRYIESVLVQFRANWRSRAINVIEFPALISSFENIIKAKVDGKSIIPFLEESSYPVAKISKDVFADSNDKKEAEYVVYAKFAALNPDKILSTIGPYAYGSAADSLIVLACRLDPVQFYSYAQSTSSPVGKLIHRSEDRMVKEVAKLSLMDNALFYFPFLDDILSGKKTLDEINKFVGDGEKTYDSIGYYRLLAKTATEYFIRTQAKDTPVAYFGSNGLLRTLKERGHRHFITPINTLHNETSLTVRMKAIQPLSAEELYYMMVFGEDEIYTSSYKHSFNRLLQLMGSKPRGDSLLLSVKFDHFKKFIKMAANYNKLDTFLKTMPNGRAEILMQNFVANLDKTGNLEDAVDVADSYSSITNKKLQQSMLANIIENEAKAKIDDNRNGSIIYGLLKTIFLSADSAIDLSAEIGIPSIYEVPNKYLQDEKGRIVQQVFWYGDEDGKVFYPQFRNSFSPREWKVSETKEWMEAVSLKGNVYVFANRPLDSDNNRDDSAQAHLASHLEDLEMTPVVTVHRGHSYWLPGTLERMAGDQKIVVLGSCGGYQNLSKILEKCPDAHIISTKEIGAGDINRPILNYINQTLASGATLSWRTMWQTLSKNFAGESRAVRESWDDYIPPYKNLGAIFLKAYNMKAYNTAPQAD